ncbi:MAG: hypothetical protein CL930_00735 [Deltaproteobacteria bacterium]|nr:hypothetical protein [Deltaproteobacteria bacterium]
MKPSAQDVASYEGLFSGAARLGLLCGVLDVPWKSVAEYVGVFSERLKGYFELSVDPAIHAIGVMTKGEGKPYAYRVTRFMEDNGISEEILRKFLVRARYFEYRNIFFKIEADGRGLQEFSTYFRRRPSLEVAHAILADGGVDTDGVGLMEAVAEVLEKRTVHFVGSAATRAGHLQEKIYFSQPDTPESWDRIHTAVRLCGLSDAEWAPIAGIREHLVGRTAFLSIGFSNGELVPGVKIDVHDVAPEAVNALISDEGVADRADLPRSVIGRSNHSYVGLRLEPGKPVRVKTYALG